MASSDISVVSQAMTLIRATPINTFDDGTNEADIAKLFYNDFVQDILSRHPWSFATKKRRLNRTTDPIGEWRYAHIVPAEALRIWVLYPDSTLNPYPIDYYDIQGQDGSRQILSNNETIYADYTVYTAESNWPGYFTQFAVHAYAALAAMPVTDDPEIREIMQRAAWGMPSEHERGGKFGTAVAIDQQQKPGDFIADSPFINARFT